LAGSGEEPDIAPALFLDLEIPEMLGVEIVVFKFH
jgi:hypothetical protein